MPSDLTQCHEGRSIPVRTSIEPEIQRADPDSDREKSSTLLQISPCKKDAAPACTSNTSQEHGSELAHAAGGALDTDLPLSPMRTSMKRPASSAACAAGFMGDKRVKRARSTVEQERCTNNVTRARALRASRARNALASSSGSNSRTQRANRRRAADPPVKGPGGMGKPGATSGSVATPSVRGKENQEGVQLTDSALATSSLRISGRSKTTRYPQWENVPESEAGGRLTQTFNDGHMHNAGLKPSSQKPVRLMSVCECLLNSIYGSVAPR